MTNKENTEMKMPTVLQTIGAGTISGIIAWFLFILWSIWINTSSEKVFVIVREKLSKPSYYYEAILSEPGFYALLFVSIIGAFIGRAKWKSSKAMWIGATLPFLVWGVLGLLGILLFCCQ